ncbi:MAG: hypothetical protein D6705_10265 [Deltaproteobacteria bacterium]|nr:MAG: hypothetical protein D6705_10265 [Deltaproteobacteria bacterium]
MIRRVPWGLLLLGAAVACGASGGTTSGGGAATDASSGGAGTSSTASGTGTATSTGTTGATGIDTVGSSTSVGFIDGDVGGICSLDPGPGPAAVPRCLPCDVYLQDCPDDERCVVDVRDIDGTLYALPVCKPMPAQPVPEGGTCTADIPPFFGVDDCDRGLVCFVDDPQTSTGTCVPFCDVYDPSSCEDPTRVCAAFADEWLSVCATPCDPLQADPCPPGLACVPSQGASTFACMPPGTGTVGAPCDGFVYCGPGLSCQPAGDVPGCMGALRCCTPYCDPADPQAAQACTAALGVPATCSEVQTTGVGTCKAAP